MYFFTKLSFIYIYNRSEKYYIVCITVHIRYKSSRCSIFKRENYHFYISKLNEKKIQLPS